MKVISGAQAYNNLLTGVRKRTFRYPSKKENGYVDGLLLPKLEPKFTLAPGEKIFTIGSCFAREIESRLVSRGFDVPVSRFMNPQMINEYNAGTILQRIESAVGRFAYHDGMGIEETEQGWLDMFLHVGQVPVELPELLYRRRVIDQLYAEMCKADTIIITLGLIETWFDTRHGCYINKAPSRTSVARDPERFQFHRMDVEDVTARISGAIALLGSEKKIILTVSPIPIEATFSSTNAIVANSYSKAVLRVVAEKVSSEFANVDYFPSFEIAMSGGTSHYQEDNIHVVDTLVQSITDHMLASYAPSPAASAEEARIVFNAVDGEVMARLTA
jgi:hypothetical protein